MKAATMGSFLQMRVRAHRRPATRTDRSARAWDNGRIGAWLVGFVIGWFLHDRLPSEIPQVAPAIVAIVAFSTFLASFVLSIMTAAGKHSFSSVGSQKEADMYVDRLKWLLSDQLVMVITALITAVLGLVWLGAAAVGSRWLVLTTLLLAFFFMSVVNVFRLAWQVWEIQGAQLDGERKAVDDRLKEKHDELKDKMLGG